jgi:type II secretory pathway component PulF
MATRPDDLADSRRSASGCRRILAACATFTVHLFVTLVIVTFLAGTVPRYEEIFDDLDVKLPPATQLIIALSRLVANYWYLLVLAFFAIDGPLAIGLQFLPQRMRWLRVCWFDSYLLAAILFLFLGNTMLYIPLTGILASLAGP